MKPIRLIIYRGEDGKWWWRAKAGNGKVADASEQGYVKKSYAVSKALRAYPDGKVEFEV